MIRKTALLLLAFFSLSIFLSAQYVPSNDEYSLKMNANPNPEKKKKKKKIPFAKPENALDLYFFLPRKSDAWTLSLTSSGGFSGTTQLIAAVNSNGNFLCNTDEDFRNRLLEKSVLDEIFDFVEAQDFTKFNRVSRSGVKYCMDCAYKTLNFQTRDGFVSRPMTDYENEDEIIKRVYDHLSELDECS